MFCHKDDHAPGFVCGLVGGHDGDCVPLEATEAGRELLALASKIGGTPGSGRTEVDVGAMARFVMGDDSVPDAFLDAGELAARSERRRMTES